MCHIVIVIIGVVVGGCWLMRQEPKEKKPPCDNYANFYQVQHWLLGKCFITCHQPQINNCPCHGFFPYWHFSTLPHPHVVSNCHQNDNNSRARTWVRFFLVILFIYSTNEYFQIMPNEREQQQRHVFFFFFIFSSYFSPRTSAILSLDHHYHHRPWWQVTMSPPM